MMRKEQIQIFILAGFSLIVLVWALQLKFSLNKIKEVNKALEAKLNQMIKEKNFMQARLEELEKRLEEEKKSNSLLAEKFDTAENMIKELQQNILNLTKDKESLERELEMLKMKEKEATETEPLASEIPQEPPLPRETAPIEEGSSTLEETIPQF